MTETTGDSPRGLPGPLPEDEDLLWQGSPSWQELAKHLFHVRLVGAYFGVLMAWGVATAFADGRGASAAAEAVVALLVPLLLVTGVIVVSARVMAKVTIYTITSKRVVFHFGLVVPRTINLPFSRLDTASFKARRNGAGNIVLSLQNDGRTRLAYFHLWPNTRPWKFMPTQPMMRGVPGVAETARILAEALLAYRAAVEPTAGESSAAGSAAKSVPDPVSGEGSASREEGSPPSGARHAPTATGAEFGSTVGSGAEGGNETAATPV